MFEAMCHIIASRVTRTTLVRACTAILLEFPLDVVTRIRLYERMVIIAVAQARITGTEAILVWQQTLAQCSIDAGDVHRRALRYWRKHYAAELTRQLGHFLCERGFIVFVTRYWSYLLLHQSACQLTDLFSTILTCPLELSLGWNGSGYYMGLFAETRLSQQVERALRVPCREPTLARFVSTFLARDSVITDSASSHPLFRVQRIVPFGSYGNDNAQCGVHVTNFRYDAWWHRYFSRATLLRALLAAIIEHYSGDTRALSGIRSTIIMLCQHVATDVDNGIDASLRTDLGNMVKVLGASRYDDMRRASAAILGELNGRLNALRNHFSHMITSHVETLGAERTRCHLPSPPPPPPPHTQ